MHKFWQKFGYLKNFNIHHIKSILNVSILILDSYSTFNKLKEITSLVLELKKCHFFLLNYIIEIKCF